MIFGVGGVSGIAAISATKPGLLPVGISPERDEMSANVSLTPVSPPPSGTEFTVPQLPQLPQQSPDGMDDFSDFSCSLAISYKLKAISFTDTDDICDKSRSTLYGYNR
ncbi:MAG: hypothetical protein JNM70_22540 [Anaerolineae bacterium]|nr:hypothetical protein [Anaerolineae bacterium]